MNSQFTSGTLGAMGSTVYESITAFLNAIRSSIDLTRTMLTNDLQTLQDQAESSYEVLRLQAQGLRVAAIGAMVGSAAQAFCSVGALGLTARSGLSKNEAEQAKIATFQERLREPSIPPAGEVVAVRPVDAPPADFDFAEKCLPKVREGNFELDPRDYHGRYDGAGQPTEAFREANKLAEEKLIELKRAHDSLSSALTQQQNMLGQQGGAIANGAGSSTGNYLQSDKKAEEANAERIKELQAAYNRQMSALYEQIRAAWSALQQAQEALVQLQESAAPRGA
jgi:hypothetical protein